MKQHGTADSYSAFLTSDEITRGALPAFKQVHNWDERWPNFQPEELRCKGSGDLRINYKALDALQSMRSVWKMPMRITSAYRSPEHNRLVGGASNSLHMQGRAFDIWWDWTDQLSTFALFCKIAESCGLRGLGIYRNNVPPGLLRFVHLDTGPRRVWHDGMSNFWDHEDVSEVP